MIADEWLGPRVRVRATVQGTSISNTPPAAASVYAAKLVLATKYQDKYSEANEGLIGAKKRLTETAVRDRLTKADVDVPKATMDMQVPPQSIDALLARKNAQAEALDEAMLLELGHDHFCGIGRSVEADPDRVAGRREDRCIYADDVAIGITATMFTAFIFSIGTS